MVWVGHSWGENIVFTRLRGRLPRRVFYRLLCNHPVENFVLKEGCCIFVRLLPSCERGTCVSFSRREDAESRMLCRENVSDSVASCIFFHFILPFPSLYCPVLVTVSDAMSLESVLSWFHRERSLVQLWDL